MFVIFYKFKLMVVIDSSYFVLAKHTCLFCKDYNGPVAKFPTLHFLLNFIIGPTSKGCFATLCCKAMLGTNTLAYWVHSESEKIVLYIFFALYQLQLEKVLMKSLI